jgi:DNA-binding NtrC family response regulator
MHPGLATAVATLVASSAAMVSVLTQAVRLAKSPDPVAIVGATGTGKSTIARVLHELSERSGRLAEISAGELNSALARDDLFGHGRGAFTGAVGERRGVFAEAHGGSVLLDDFHWLKRSRQYVLLRVFDRLDFRQLGSDRTIPFQARILVGAHLPLEELMRKGRLVPDLRWRLGLDEIVVPPLADRLEDIAPLALRFLEDRRVDSGTEGPTRINPPAIAVLELHDWPGNVRQLRAVVRRAFTEAGGREEIGIEHLVLGSVPSPVFDPDASPVQKRRLVRWALWRSGDQVSEAARLIRAHRNTVSGIRGQLQTPAAGQGSCLGA